MYRTFPLVAAVTLLAIAPALRASISIIDPTYGVTPIFTDPVASNQIVSFDWGSDAAIYYMASNTTTYGFLGLFRTVGGLPTNPVPANTDFAGSSVIAIGDYVYFNTDDLVNQKIFRSGPISGGLVTTLTSITSSYYLAEHDGALLITGANPNHIFRTTLNASGGFVADPPTDLGNTSANSGPITFDAAGNLFYAPGYGNQSIFKWTAAEYAAAVADPTTNPLSADGHLWRDYSGEYAPVSGATSLAFAPNGTLLATLTNFVGPSVLVGFGVNGTTGDYAGNNTILSTDGRIGEIRLQNGSVFFSNDNQILQLVPEPATGVLLTLAFASMAVRRRRA